MNIPLWVWLVTVAGLAAVIIVDFHLVSRNPHDPSLRECLGWISAYVGLAVLFGLGVLALAGPQYGGEFFAGWITEYSLSVDNLFVFVIIMSTFAVPREYRQKVLSIGIVLALGMRALFILVGAQMVAQFDWLFYLFGAFLVYTAWKVFRHDDAGEDEFQENVVLRLVKRVVPATAKYSGASLFTTVDGRRMVTPMLIVMVTLFPYTTLFRSRKSVV